MRIQVGPLEAHNVNLSSGEFVAGLPAPSAFVGFAGALLRHSGLETWDYSVFPVLHSVSLSEGRQRSQPTASGRSETLEAVELSEQLMGAVCFSMIIDIGDRRVDLDAARGALQKMRFAGGTIVSGISANHHVHNMNALVGNHPAREILASRIRDMGRDESSHIMPRGYALTPPLDREGAEIVSFGDLETLTAVRDVAHSREKGGGFMVPANVGFRLLEDPLEARPRASGRAGYPHVFAEPSVGIAELISVRNPKVADLSFNELLDRFWGWSASAADHRHLMMSRFHLSAVERNAA